MKLQSLCADALEIPFRTSFRHASAERSKMASVWVEARDAEGITGHGEGCPREYVTGESVASALDFIASKRECLVADVSDLPTLRGWSDRHGSEIDRAPAAWCAVELALLDLLGRRGGEPQETLLGIAPLAGPFRYSAVLGDSEPAAFDKQVAKYIAAGFRDFKIKLSGDGERDRSKVDALRDAGPGLRLRADANNLWCSAEQVIAHVGELGQPFWAMEEPLAARDFEGMARIAAALGTRIILDESLARAEDIEAVAARADIFVPNLRVSKLGGLLRGLSLLGRARELGFRVVIGAHVGETSVLTRAGLTLAAAAGDALLAIEGAFGTHLLQRDPCEPPLMFGAGGVLDPSGWLLAKAPGNGLVLAWPPSVLDAPK